MIIRMTDHGVNLRAALPDPHRLLKRPADEGRANPRG